MNRGKGMKEKEARELLKELFERHCISSIPVKFHPTPMITKGEDIPELKEAGLGHLAAAVTVITKGEFKVDPVTGERWFEFYGRPSPNDVRHEFRHYLDHLGVEYIRKKS